MPSACLAISYASRRLPQMSTFSTFPPSLRTTLRNASKDGATVRSSSVGSRMTMISYGRMETSPPPLVCAATVGPWQEGRLRRQPPQVTGCGADRRNPRGAARLLAGLQVFVSPGHGRLVGLGERARVERRLRVVFDEQLSGLRGLPIDKELDQPQGHVDAAGHARGGDDALR